MKTSIVVLTCVQNLSRGFHKVRVALSDRHSFALAIAFLMVRFQTPFGTPRRVSKSRPLKFHPTAATSSSTISDHFHNTNCGGNDPKGGRFCHQRPQSFPASRFETEWFQCLKNQMVHLQNIMGCTFNDSVSRYHFNILQPYHQRKLSKIHIHSSRRVHFRK